MLPHDLMIEKHAIGRTLFCGETWTIVSLVLIGKKVAVTEVNRHRDD